MKSLTKQIDLFARHLLVAVALSLGASAFAQAYSSWDGMGGTSGTLYVNPNGWVSIQGWIADGVSGTSGVVANVYVDGNFVAQLGVGGDRPDVASAFGRSDFRYSGIQGGFTANQSVSTWHTVEIWMGGGPSGWIRQTNSISTGNTFYINNTTPPVVNVTSPTSGALFYINTTANVTGTASDPTGTMSTHNVDVQWPDGVWSFQGRSVPGASGTWIGPPTGGGSTSTRNTSFAPNVRGNWHIRSYGYNTAGSSWGPNGMTGISLTVVNQPTVNAYVDSSSLYFGQGTTYHCTWTTDTGLGDNLIYSLVGVNSYVSGATYWNNGSYQYYVNWAGNAQNPQTYVFYATSPGTYTFSGLTYTTTQQSWTNWGTSASVTVLKATPNLSAFPNQSFTQGTAISAAMLNVTASNPYNGGAGYTPTGTITYSAAGYGAVTAGTVLPTGTWTITASYPGDTGHNATSRSATFYVEPAPVATVTFGANPIVYGQSTSVTMQISQAAPGSLLNHWMLWDGGAGQYWTGIGFGWNYASNTTGMSAISDLSGGPTAANSSTKSFIFTPWAVNAGGYQFLSWGQNNLGVTPNWSQLGLVVIKATPSVTGWANQARTGTGTFAAAFTANFINPYNSQSLGVSSYTVVAASGGGASPTSGAVSAATTFTPGSYTVRAAYNGDTNHNTASKDVTFTVNNVAPTIALTANGNSTAFAVNFGQSLSISATETDPDGNLGYQGIMVNWQANGVWYKYPGTNYSWWGAFTDSSYWTSINQPIGNTVSSGSSNTISGTFLPWAVGNWLVHSNGFDLAGTWSNGPSFWVTVNKAIPTLSAFSNQSYIQGNAITAAMLNVTASNPYNGGANFTPTGAITYSAAGYGAVTVGTVLPVGTWTVTASYPGDAGHTATSASATFTVITPPPVISSAGSATMTYVNNVFAGYTIAGSNSPTSYNASGLPPGLSVNTATGVISGTPTVAGTYTVTVSATNAGGTGSQPVTFRVPSKPTTAISATTTNINFGQSTTLTGTFTVDSVNGDGLIYTIFGASNANITSDGGVTYNGGAWSPQPNYFSWYSDGRNPHTSVVTPLAPGSYTFYPDSYTDGNPAWADWSGASLTVTVAPTTPTGTFANATKTPTGTTYTAVVGDFTASFANPYSGSVTQPSGAKAYTISPVSPNGTPGSAVVAGTTFSAGLTYVLRATVAADYNYNSNYAESTWTINKAAQSITFANPGAQAYTTPLTLSGSASSGLPITWSVISGNATVSGNVLSFTGTGFVTVQAAQGGNTNWQAAAVVQQTFNVVPAPTTFTITPVSFTYNGAVQGPAITPSPAASTYTTSGTSSAIVPGPYSVTATANGNYTGSSGAIAWVINKAPQTITFANPGAQTYGTPLSLIGSSTSGLAISWSLISGNATLSGSTLTFTGTGQVTVQAAQTGDSNYNAAAAVQQTFTVNPQPTTFSLSATAFPYSGAAQGPTVVANPASATFTAGGTLSAVNGGPYVATASATGNYTGTNNALNWNINPIGQTITFANPGTKQYLTFPANYTLTASASSGLPITYAVTSGPATVSGSTLTITGAGTITVQASQAGNSNYTAAVPVSQSFMAQQLYILTVNSGTGGSAGTSGNFGSGTAAPLTASANVGYRFLNWTGDAVASSTSASTTITMSADSTVTANFIPIWVVTASAGTGGIATGGGTYDNNAVATLIAVPNAGYRFGNWTGPDAGLLSNANTASTTITATKAINVTANFVKVYNLTVTSTAGGTTSGSGTYDAGAVATVSVAVSANYLFAGWNGANAANLANSSLQATTVTMNGDYTVNANIITGASATNAGVLDVGSAVVSSGPGNHNSQRDISESLEGNVSSVAVTGFDLDSSPAPGEFTIAAPSPATVTIAGATSTINFQAGTTVGTRTGTLVIVSDDPSTPTRYYNLTAQATKASQTITFNVIPGQTYGGGALNVSSYATASSSLPVSFSVVSGPATLAGNELTFTGAGTVLIQADQPGNGIYYSAPPSQRTIIVSKAPLTVGANNASMTYGAALPVFTAAYSGFVNGDTIAVLSGTPSLTTSATSTSNVGTYTIVATGGTLSAANYSFAFNNGTLTISPASLTVTANNVSKVAGTANPAFSASYSGFMNGETAAVLSGSPSLTTLADNTSPVGAYAITAAAGSLAATNYSFGFADGTLTVTKASPGISFPVIPSTTSGQSQALGASLVGGFSPTGSVTYSIIATTGGATGTIAPASQVNVTGLGIGNPGSITVLASYAGDSNNNASSVSTTFSVPDTVPTITGAGPDAITYGQTAAATINIADPDRNLLSAMIEYLPPGGSSWSLLDNPAFAPGSSGSPLAFSHTPTSAGTWQYRVSATDGSGVTSSYTTYSVVVSAAPTTTSATFSAGGAVSNNFSTDAITITATTTSNVTAAAIPSATYTNTVQGAVNLSSPTYAIGTSVPATFVSGGIVTRPGGVADHGESDALASLTITVTFPATANYLASSTVLTIPLRNATYPLNLRLKAWSSTQMQAWINPSAVNQDTYTVQRAR